MTTEMKKRPLLLVLLYIGIMAVGFSDGAWSVPWFTKYIMQLLVIGIGFGFFFVTADINRLKTIGTFFVMYGIPFLLMLMLSATFWLLDFQTLNYMSRGFSTILYHIIALMFICSAVYLFGGRAVDYTLYGMILANIGIVLSSIKTYGISALASGLVVFAKSGGLDTVPAVKALEVHDLTFAFGLMLMYYVLFEKGLRRVLSLIPIILFFLLGYKRIGVMGLMGVLLIFLLLVFLKEKGRWRVVQVLTLAGIVVCFFYVYVVESGLFDTIVDYLEWDTAGRKELYKQFTAIYDFSPSFRGHGIGYVTRYISILTDQGVGIFGEHGFGGMHNDIATMYIELGFWGFSFWIWYNLRKRIFWIWKKEGMKTAMVLIYGTVYTFITYATDNTVFYCYINTIFMLLPLAYAVKQQEMKGGEPKHEKIT